jgi:hypothetical protein
VIFRPLFLFQTNVFETSIVEKKLSIYGYCLVSNFKKSQLWVIIRVTKNSQLLFILFKLACYLILKISLPTRTQFGADPFRYTKATTCLGMVPIVMKNLNFLFNFFCPPKLIDLTSYYSDFFSFQCAP